MTARHLRVPPGILRQRPLPLWVAVLATSAWMATAGNLPLWHRLAALQLAGPGRGWMLPLGLLVAMTAALTAMLGLLGWKSTFRLAATVLLLFILLTSLTARWLATRSRRRLSTSR